MPLRVQLPRDEADPDTERKAKIEAMGSQDAARYGVDAEGHCNPRRCEGAHIA